MYLSRSVWEAAHLPDGINTHTVTRNTHIVSKRKTAEPVRISHFSGIMANCTGFGNVILVTMNTVINVHTAFCRNYSLYNLDWTGMFELVGFNMIRVLIWTKSVKSFIHSWLIIGNRYCRNVGCIRYSFSFHHWHWA